MDKEKTAMECHNEDCLFAYDIAKMICEKKKNYMGALEIIELAEGQIKKARDLTQSKLLPYAINRYNEKVNTPDDSAPGESGTNQ